MDGASDEPEVSSFALFSMSEAVGGVTGVTGAEGSLLPPEEASPLEGWLGFGEGAGGGSGVGVRLRIRRRDGRDFGVSAAALPC